MLVHEDLTRKIIGAAMRVHGELGPGLLESAYESVLAHELAGLNLQVQRQVLLDIAYHGLQVDSGYRIDLLVEDAVIVELKSVSSLEPIHKAQLLTYMRLANRPVGLLINFNVVHLHEGIARCVLTTLRAGTHACDSAPPPRPPRPPR